MNVDQRNALLSTDCLNRDDVWPKFNEYQSQRFQFRWEFGLDKLPKEAGLITVRGFRHNKTLNIISDSKFQTDFLNSRTLEEFLYEAPSKLYFDDDRLPEGFPREDEIS